MFCSEFPNIPDKAGRIARRRTTTTQEIAKGFAFQASAMNERN